MTPTISLGPAAGAAQKWVVQLGGRKGRVTSDLDQRQHGSSDRGNFPECQSSAKELLKVSVNPGIY